MWHYIHAVPLQLELGNCPWAQQRPLDRIDLSHAAAAAVASAGAAATSGEASTAGDAASVASFTSGSAGGSQQAAPMPTRGDCRRVLDAMRLSPDQLRVYAQARAFAPHPRFRLAAGGTPSPSTSVHSDATPHCDSNRFVLLALRTAVPHKSLVQHTEFSVCADSGRTWRL